MNATYGKDITVEHTCHKVGKKPTTKIGTVDQPFQQHPLQELRNTRHKNLCDDVRGGILEHNERKELFTTTDIVNLALATWKTMDLLTSKLEQIQKVLYQNIV